MDIYYNLYLYPSPITFNSASKSSNYSPTNHPTVALPVNDKPVYHLLI